MNQHLFQEAAEWLVELRCEATSTAARQRFGTWLSTSPEHVRAYLELTCICEVVGAAEPASDDEIESLIARAKTTSNVIALGAPVHAASPVDASARIARRRHRSVFVGLAAAAASLMIVIAITALWHHAQRSTYSTAIGEQRSILLPDGSTVELNARSAVRVRFSERQRSIDLLRGQALFHVTKDRSRPFVVNSEQMRVRAVGTTFDVNQRRRTTIVTVVEGTVAVESAEPESLLEAGEQAVLTDGGHPTPRRTDVVTAIAWTQRRLIFDTTPIEEVAEEFNRNTAREIVVDGEELADFHVSRAFSSADPAPLLRFLRDQEGIQVVERDDRIFVSRARER
jgi:transmembrane sensor